MSSPTDDRSDANGQETSDAADPMSYWNQFFQQSDQQARAFLDAMRTAADPLEVQRRWLDAVSQNFESFLRSPAFLETMKRNMDATIALKQSQNRLIKDSAAELGVPTAADVTGLFERLNSVERSILSQLKTIEARLSALESRMKASPSGDPQP